MHKLFKLKSGIRVVLIPKKDSQVVTIACGFAVGSRHEREHEQGISHFLEHMIYQGAKRRKTPREVSEYIDSLGASHNAFTGKEYTGYYLKINSGLLEKGIDVLSDNIVYASVPKKEVEKERKVILEEIDMHEDIPFDKVSNAIESTLYSKSPLSRDVIGTKKTVQSISKDEIKEYKKNHYCKDNLVVSIAGNYDLFSDQQLAELVDRYFAGLPPKMTRTDGYAKSYENILLYPKDIEQTNFILAFKGPSELDLEKFSTKLAVNILSGSISSRLYAKIREELGLVYAIEGYADTYGDDGSIQIYAGLDKKNISLALTEIKKEIKKMIEESICQQELDRAKRIITTRILISSEDSATLAFDYLTSLLVCNKIETPEEKIKKYKLVTLEEVNEAAKKYLSEKIYISAVGPGLDKEKINKIISKRS